MHAPTWLIVWKVGATLVLAGLGFFSFLSLAENSEHEGPRPEAWLALVILLVLIVLFPLWYQP